MTTFGPDQPQAASSDLITVIEAADELPRFLQAVGKVEDFYKSQHPGFDFEAAMKRSGKLIRYAQDLDVALGIESLAVTVPGCAADLLQALEEAGLPPEISAIYHELYEVDLAAVSGNEGT